MTEPTEEQRAAATAILNNTELAEAIAALIAERDAANRGRDAAKELAAQWGFRLAEAEEQRDMLSLRRGRGLPRSEVRAMTRDEAAIERMARAIYARADVQVRENGGIDADGLLPWEDPGCGRETAREQACDAFAALLSDPSPAVERAMLERLIARADNQEWGGTVRADLWLRRELAELAREESDGGH